MYRSPAATILVRILAIGGGGGGAGRNAGGCGGGGGSGYVEVASKTLLPNTDYLITVGSGGGAGGS